MRNNNKIPKSNVISSSLADVKRKLQGFSDVPNGVEKTNCKNCNYYNYPAIKNNKKFCRSCEFLIL